MCQPATTKPAGSDTVQLSWLWRLFLLGPVNRCRLRRKAARAQLPVEGMSSERIKGLQLGFTLRR